MTSLLSGPLLQKAREKVSRVRQKRLRRAGAGGGGPADAAAGLLLRSALVSGWPGISIDATAKGEPVNILRMDQVSPSILLVLWDAVPDTVALSAPRQGLAFGADSAWTLPLRSLSPSSLGAPLHKSFPSSGDLTQFMRPPSQGAAGGVLNLVPTDRGAPGYLVPALAAALGRTSDLSPSELAIEMVRSPERLEFRLSP